MLIVCQLSRSVFWFPYTMLSPNLRETYKTALQLVQDNMAVRGFTLYVRMLRRAIGIAN
jgi:hypothetical protein